MCDCNCPPNTMADVAPPPQKRYHVSANKSIYVSESYDTVEEALAKMTELASQGFPGVHLRDNENQDDAW